MSGGSTTRKPRQSRPGLEGLEGRLLLDAGVSADGQFSIEQSIAATTAAAAMAVATKPTVAAKSTADATTTIAATTPSADKRFAYTAPGGAKVVITLYGAGSLKGTFVDPDGALNLRFSGTNAQTGIVGTVTGGSGRAPIRTMVHSTLPINSISGIGSTLVRVVNLSKFDLVAGGRINLAAGVQTFLLRSASVDSSVQLREIPPEVLNNNASNVNQNGVTLGFAIDLAGAQTLTTTSGTFIPGFNLLPTNIPNKPNKQTTPPGIVAVIDQINGPKRDTGIGPAQVYGYDPAADALVRFDISFDPISQSYVGASTVVRAGVLGATGVEAGVTLGRNSGKLVLLISDGATVQAFDALDATPVGSFSVTGLAGLPNPTRLGNVDSFTVIGDPTAGVDGAGVIQVLNVTESLATGTAVVVGTPFAATRGFSLSGGMSGVPGSSTLYAAGGAHFDTFVPDQFQLGAVSIVPGGSRTDLRLNESARNALTSRGSRITSDAKGGTIASKNDALASFNTNLALVTASGGGTNTLTLFNPQTFARTGAVTLNYSGTLSGVTSVYRSALKDAALVDVQGNVQSFRSQSTRGLVLNDTGNLNLVKIQRAVDTTIIANPFGHAIMPNRSNVRIFSSSRTPVDRNGVTVVSPNIQPTGPLSLP